MLINHLLSNSETYSLKLDYETKVSMDVILKHFGFYSENLKECISSSKLELCVFDLLVQVCDDIENLVEII